MRFDSDFTQISGQKKADWGLWPPPLQQFVEKHNHREHSESLVTLETYNQSYEETWPDMKNLRFPEKIIEAI